MKVSENIASNTFIELHPYPSFIPQEANKIFIGSFPPIKLTRKLELPARHPLIEVFNAHLLRNPKRAKDIDFYYGNEKNYFWKLLGDIYGENLTNLSSIKKTLTKERTAVTDIIESCIRKVYNKKRWTHFLPSASTVLDTNSSYSVSSGDNSLFPVQYRNIPDILEKHKTITTLIFTSSYSFRHFIRAFPDIELSGEKPQFTWKTTGRSVRIFLLPSPSGAANISIGRSKDYLGRKKENPGYSTYRYRLEEYEKVLLNQP